MKPMDPLKEKLFDDLMIDREEGRATPGVDEVVALVQSAKEARSHRRMQRRVALSLALACTLTAAIVTARRSRTADSSQGPRSGFEQTDKNIAAAAATKREPAIERLDDNALLDLLDATPSALVEWPDGRKELLLVVGAAAPVPTRRL